MQLIMLINCNNVKHPNRIYNHKMGTPHLKILLTTPTYICSDLVTYVRKCSQKCLQMWCSHFMVVYSIRMFYIITVNKHN